MSEDERTAKVYLALVQEFAAQVRFWALGGAGTFLAS